MNGGTSFRLGEGANCVGTSNSKRNKDCIKAGERVKPISNIIKANEPSQDVFILCCKEGVYFSSLNEFFQKHLYSHEKCLNFPRIQRRLVDYETFYKMQSYTLSLYNTMKRQLSRLDYYRDENIRLKYSLSKMSRKK